MLLHDVGNLGACVLVIYLAFGPPLIVVPRFCLTLRAVVRVAMVIPGLGSRYRPGLHYLSRPFFPRETQGGPGSYGGQNSSVKASVVECLNILWLYALMSLKIS